MTIRQILILSILSLTLFSCAKLDRVLDKADNDIPNNLNKTNANMLELKRLTILGQMTVQLQDTDKYEVLSPVPFDLLAPGKLAAENFTTSEIVEWSVANIGKINEGGYDDNHMGKVSSMDNPDAIQYERNKIGLFNAVSTVTAFLPQSVVDEMVARIQSSEEHTETMLALLAMRAFFIHKVLLKEVYAPSKLTSLGDVESAIKYNQSIEKILKLPFASSIRSKITGFSLLLGVNEQMTFDLSGIDLKTNWKNIERGMNSYLKVTQFSTDPQTARVARARNQVNAGLQANGATPAAALVSSEDWPEAQELSLFR